MHPMPSTHCPVSSPHPQQLLGAPQRQAQCGGNFGWALPQRLPRRILLMERNLYLQQMGSQHAAT